MASFKLTFEKFKGIEFSNPNDILHKNKGENGLTYYGIYQSAHPYLPFWVTIKSTIKRYKGNLKKASIYLSSIKSLEEDVKKFYKTRYFNPLKLGQLKHQNVANEIFYFAINQGSLKRAIKYAQCVVGGLVCDGVIGKKTITKLNNLTEEELKIFDKKYDKKEIDYYFSLKTSKNLKWWLRYIKGWVHRAIKI